MSETAGKPNGGVVQKVVSPIEFLPYATGEDDSPDQPLGLITENQPKEYIETRELYRVFSPHKKDFTAEATIARISQTAADCLPHLVEAISEPDELQRENHAALAFAEIFRLARFVGRYSSFDDALALILSALAAHRSAPYSPRELVVFRGILEKLRRNPVPTEADLSSLHNTLIDAGFDLNAPFAGLDLWAKDEG